MNTDERTMECLDSTAMETNQGSDVRLNEVAAGMLGKTVDTAVAVSQFAVGLPLA